MTILCLASYEKGHEFLRECKRQGATVLLVTSLSLKDKAKWPVDSIDEIFYMPDEDRKWDRSHLVHAVSYLGRTHVFNRIVGLDDFDVETAAMLREHLRVQGSGETIARYYRDKLAMRTKARECGIPVPDFIHVLNHERLRNFMARVPPPWVLKPRSMAGSIGIRKIYSEDEFWLAIDTLGDMQSHYLLERFIPGEIYHVDSIVFDREVRFAIASRYGRPPMQVSHEGGVFTSRTLFNRAQRGARVAPCALLDRESSISHDLCALNAHLMTAFGLVRGVSHSEFIRGEDGELYFLETSSRVGGAHVADLIEAATGLNMWAEWAKVETSADAGTYEPQPLRQENAGLLVALARELKPDTSAYNDPEVVWRMKEDYHVGLIVRSPSAARVEQLLTSYAERITRDFLAVLPPRDRPTN